MLIVLPPSEGKATPARGKPLDLATLSSPGLNPTRQRVIDALVETSSRPDAARILGLSPGLRDLIDLNADLKDAPTARADAIYTGVLYDTLGFASLSSTAKRRANSRVAVTSSVFGLVRPNDRIPTYRLSGDASLPGLGSVAAQWRQSLGAAVRDALGSGLLVDLRSTTYAAFWRPEADLAPRLATVRVLQESDGKRSVVSHFNKATKGRLVRALLEDGATPRRPATLAEAWRDLGWMVEETDQGSTGTRLDVIVAQV